MDDLFRSVPFELIRAEDGDGLTLEGYAAVFDSPTEIDSWEGNFLETIQRGAFKKTLRERTPVLMFDHGQHPLIGQLPIGTIKAAREDNRGLYVSARLAANWMIEPVREAIREEAITGMSFRFRPVRDSWTEPTKRGGPRVRTLLEVSVSELGPVVMPAYRDTSVAVRSLLSNNEFMDAVIKGMNSQTYSTSTDAAWTDVTAFVRATTLPGTSVGAAASNAETPEPEATTSRVPATERRKRALELRKVISEQEARRTA